MGQILRIIISIPIILFFLSLSYLAFSISLNNDSYIHLLKDSFKGDISEINNGLVGFKSTFVSSEKEITSTFGNYPVIFSHLEFQNYVCDESGEDRSCSWHTYRTEQASTPFTVKVNDREVSITQISDVEFHPEDAVIFNQTSQHRMTESVITKYEPIYIWGYLENNEIKNYKDTEHNKDIFIVTNNAKQTLIDKISGVLIIQTLSAASILLMAIILFIVNTRGKVKSYLAKNSVGLAQQKRSPKIFFIAMIIMFALIFLIIYIIKQ